MKSRSDLILGREVLARMGIVPQFDMVRITVRKSSEVVITAVRWSTSSAPESQGIRATTTTPRV